MYSNQSALLISASVLYIKFLATILIQGGVAFKAGTRPPEDINLKNLARDRPQSYGINLPTPATPSLTDAQTAAKLLDARYRRLVLNDVENIPLGLILFLISLPTAASPVVYQLSVYGFVLARCMHSVAYAMEMQPARSYTWMAAVTCVMATALNGLIGAF